MSSPALLVIADDLTGANDAGAQFALAGIRSLVLSDPHRQRLPQDYPVVVVNSESRHLPAREAAERVRKLVILGAKTGVKHFFKKTDSKLRGNIGAELQALLQAAEAPFLPFVPALPDLGRTTRAGIHYVDGVPIGETAFARDPLNPIRTSRVAEILACPTCSVLPRDAGSPPPGSGIAIVDCSSNEDLEAVAQALAGAGKLKVASGSVGLLKYLAPHLNLDSTPPAAPNPRPPILLVNGSLNGRSLEQIHAAPKHFSRLRLTPDHLIGRRADLTIPAGDLLLHSIIHPSELDGYLQYARASGVSERHLHLHVAERTGQIVHKLLSTGVYRTVIVFGGDTLAGIARASHWRSFEPLTELEPGLSVSAPTDTNLTLITKAGGFGDSKILERVALR